MSMTADALVRLDDYVPIGSNWDICTAKEQEVIGTGPSGTGKTRAVMEKIHRACKTYTNIKVLLLRKRESDLAGSALEMLRDHVAGSELHTGEVRYYDKTRSEPARYEYAQSGSVIVLGGLWPPPQATKVLHSEWDIICVIAANELTEPDWELLIPLCRNGSLPVNQLIGVCRPQGDDHWILQRAERGQLRLIEGQHEDNPRWYRNGVLTAEGRAFMAKLDALTGVNKLRVRFGMWVGPQGMCLPSFDRNIHLIDPFLVPYEWPQWWSIDFGKVHPFAWGQWTIDPSNGVAYLIREIHMTQRETEDHCEHIRYLTRDQPRPVEIITDHSANDRLIAERIFGRKVVLANKSVMEGVDYLDKRFAQRKLFVFRNSLVEVDQSLADKGRPLKFTDEIPGYTWKKGKRSKEGPMELWNDGCLVAETMITTSTGDKQISQVEVGDRVLTRAGWRPVLVSRMTNPLARVVQVHLSNGQTLTGTENHPAWVRNMGWVQLDKLRYGDILEPCPQSKPLSSTASLSAATPSRHDGLIGSITARASKTRNEASGPFIKRSGRASTVRSLRGARFIMPTSMHSTTIQPTWSASPSPNTRKLIESALACVDDHQNRWNTWTRSDRLPKPGTNPRRAEPGIAPTLNNIGSAQNRDLVPVINAVPNSPPRPHTGRVVSAQTTASQPGDELSELITSSESAPSAALSSPLIGTAEPDAAAVCVLGVSELAELQPVFNLTVDDHHEYFAQGVLVKNCDMARYFVMEQDAPEEWEASWS